MPHKDYIEFHKNYRNFLRFLIPLNYNVNSCHYGLEGSIKLSTEAMYFIDARLAHGAINDSIDDRYILSIDLYNYKSLPYTEFIESALLFENQNITLEAQKNKDLHDYKMHINEVDFFIKKNQNNLCNKTIKDVFCNLTRILYIDEKLKSYNDIFEIIKFLIKKTNLNNKKEILEEIENLYKFLFIERELNQRFDWSILDAITLEIAS